jgi:predicted amidohydrolase
MNEKTIAAISLSNRDFPSFEAKLAEAATWIEHAAGSGAQLAVLPEEINNYRGDGPGNPLALSLAEMAVDDWRRAIAPLFDVAVRCRIAVTAPLLVRENGSLSNSFFMISRQGEVLGRYDKMRPAPGEFEGGVRPGSLPRLIEWEGLRIGGAICFDTLFPDVFRCQAEMGADLFLVPSLWPGGSYLNYYALVFSTPIVLAYPAWSRIIDITGREVAAGGYRNETLRFGFGAPVVMATLNFDRVSLYGNINQERIVEVERRYGAKVRVLFDQQNCMFYLESRSPDLTVTDVMKEFELVPCRKYLSDFERAIRSQRP